MPQKGADKAYTLLRPCLAAGKKVGIAKVVIKPRQYLTGVTAMKDVLVLELLHFAEELSDAEKLNVPKKVHPAKREAEMAKALVESMTSKWDPEKYRDDYREALLEVIEEKVESGGKEIAEKPKAKQSSSKVIDLVAVLQQSLAQSQGGKKKPTAQTSRKPRRARTHKKAEKIRPWMSFDEEGSLAPAPVIRSRAGGRGSRR